MDTMDVDTTTMTGKVKFFKTKEGYGFISPDGGDSEVFVHISTLEKLGLPSLLAGQKVSYETQPDKRGRGPQALKLKLIE